MPKWMFQVFIGSLTVSALALAPVLWHLAGEMGPEQRLAASTAQDRQGVVSDYN